MRMEEKEVQCESDAETDNERILGDIIFDELLAELRN